MLETEHVNIEFNAGMVVHENDGAEAVVGQQIDQLEKAPVVLDPLEAGYKIGITKRGAVHEVYQQREANGLVDDAHVIAGLDDDEVNDVAEVAFMVASQLTHPLGDQVANGGVDVGLKCSLH